MKARSNVTHWRGHAPHTNHVVHGVPCYETEGWKMVRVKVVCNVGQAENAREGYRETGGGMLRF